MQPRIKSPVFAFPGTREALLTLTKATENCGIPRSTFELIHLRASQINGCSVCVDMHSRMLRKLGEKAERIFTAAVWRETPYFSDAERAAFALTEAMCRLSDREDPVPDEIWNEAASHYNETQLAALVLSIATINVWNRLNAATRQVGGEFLEQYI